MLHTTFNRLKLAGARKLGSGVGYDKLAQALGGTSKYGKDTPIPLTKILESNGLDDAVWCLRATIEDYQTYVKPLIRRFMGDLLEHITLAALSESSIELLTEGVVLLRDSSVSNPDLERYADRAARAAAWTAEAARDAAWTAAWAARAARAAALTAAWAAAWTAEAARDARAARAAEAARQTEQLAALLALVQLNEEEKI